jgi:hypothetical protein
MEGSPRPNSRNTSWLTIHLQLDSFVSFRTRTWGNSLDTQVAKAGREKDARMGVYIWTGSCFISEMTLESKPKGVRRTCRRCDDTNDTRTNENNEGSL